MTQFFKSALARTTVAALLLGIAGPVFAADAAYRYDPDVHITQPAAASDPIEVGSVASAKHVVTGSPITTEDVDPSQCAPGQLVLNFSTGKLTCDWAVAE